MSFIPLKLSVQKLCLMALCGLLLLATSLVTVGRAVAQPAPAAPPVADYTLGSGDKVRITVFGEESLSGEFLVSSAGAISMPLVGDIAAGGRTIGELQRDLTARLSDGYLKDPRVSAEVLTYRPFYILGEVNKPGEYPYTAGLNLMKAVATAEGFTYRANTKQAFVRRSGAQGEVKVPLTATTPVGPGDTIRIRERFF
ncbi:MAG TPA: polysaccharide biosynthesis/export family protein [Phenylobacterium sp.]